MSILVALLLIITVRLVWDLYVLRSFATLAVIDTKRLEDKLRCVPSLKTSSAITFMNFAKRFDTGMAIHCDSIDYIDYKCWRRMSMRFPHNVLQKVCNA